MFYRAIGLVFVICVAGKAFAAARIHREFGFEGTCTSPPGQLATNLDLGWITSIPKWYISYGSLLFWVQNAEVCLGRAPLGFEELSRICLQTNWDLNTTMTCFGKSVSQECSIVKNGGNPYAGCEVSRADPGTNPSVFDDFKKRVVLTDNKTFALFVRCTDGLKSYYIATVTPTLNHFSYVQSAIKIALLGFDLRLLKKIPYGGPHCGQSYEHHELYQVYEYSHSPKNYYY